MFRFLRGSSGPKQTGADKAWLRVYQATTADPPPGEPAVRDKPLRDAIAEGEESLRHNPEHYGLLLSLGRAYVRLIFRKWPVTARQAAMDPELSTLVDKALGCFEKAYEVGRQLGASAQLLPPDVIAPAEGDNYPPEHRAAFVAASAIVGMIKQLYWSPIARRTDLVIKYATPIHERGWGFQPESLSLADAVITMGRFEEAEQILRKAGRFKVKEAQDGVAEALRLFPQRRRRGLYNQKLWPDLIAALVPAEGQWPGEVEDLLMLSDAYEGIGDRERARGAAKRALALDEHSSRAQAKLRALVEG